VRGTQRSYKTRQSGPALRAVVYFRGRTHDNPIQRVRLWQAGCIHTGVKLLICFILALASLTAGTGAPRYGTRSRIGTGRTGTRASRSRSGSGLHSRCESCERDSRGSIVRSAAARREFRSANPCPSTGRTTGACGGYVVDHIKALKPGYLASSNSLRRRSSIASFWSLGAAVGQSSTKFGRKQEEAKFGSFQPG
jgi:hypothetical protein